MKSKENEAKWNETKENETKEHETSPSRKLICQLKKTKQNNTKQVKVENPFVN